MMLKLFKTGEAIKIGGKPKEKISGHVREQIRFLKKDCFLFKLQLQLFALLREHCGE